MKKEIKGQLYGFQLNEASECQISAFRGLSIQISEAEMVFRLETDKDTSLVHPISR